MKKILSIFCSFAILCGLSVTPTYAAENKIEGGPQAEIIATSDNDMIFDDNGTRDFLTDKTRGTKKPSTDSVWDIYLQDYVFNLDFDTALYSNYNYTNHGGEIKVTITCESSNPNDIKMELYQAGKTDCLATLEFKPSGTTTGRFYNLDLKTNYYFKFVTPDNYNVTGEGRLYKN